MKKILIVLSVSLFIGLVGWYLNSQYHMYWETHEVRELEIPGKWAPSYLSVAKKYQLSWVYLAAIDEVKTKYKKVGLKTIEAHAQQLRKQLDQKESTPDNVKQALLQIYSREDVSQMMQIADSYEWEAAPLSKTYVFPFRKQDRNQVSYSDSWGAERTYGGKRKHQGTDLMAPKGTSLVSVTDGEVVRKGWDRLGGWRLLIRDTKYPYIYYYYAHLNKYAVDIEEGTKVHKGQVIGYVGNSGYGPEGTTGQFSPHLHFGVYVQEGLFSPQRKAINPYPFLKAWDVKK